MGAIRPSSDSTPQSRAKEATTVIASSASSPSGGLLTSDRAMAKKDLLDVKPASSVRGGKAKSREGKGTSTTFLLGDASQSSRFMFPGREEGLNPNSKEELVTTVSFGRKLQPGCSLQGRRSSSIGTGGVLSLGSARRPASAASLRNAMQNLSNSLADVALRESDSCRSPTPESFSLGFLPSGSSDDATLISSLGLFLGDAVRADTDSATAMNPLSHTSFLDHLLDPNGTGSPSWDDLAATDDLDVDFGDEDADMADWSHEEQGQQEESRALVAQIISQQEAALEEQIIEIITSGAWDSLLPNSGQSVPLNGHHICVEYREESQKGTSGAAGGAYRTWEWHGHLMVYDGSFGYNAEYVYGNYFEPLFGPVLSEDEIFSYYPADVASSVSDSRGLRRELGGEATSCIGREAIAVC
eukprot:TRINITY_DN18941_c0_g1_i1.p1 TRINITY_DN18941_c0_g1~~TRINITY_DN18941_c0_g1_i1.p1  ORF type:complete len:414 (-),score=57.57 TRINITY_DN18941_c0_g1_i1:1188-2429(-)